MDGELITDTATVRFATAEYPVQGGTTVIDCANYPTFQDKDIVIDGTLTINTAGCAPMSFGIVTIEPNSMLTHATSTDTVTQSLDLIVDGLRVKPTGKIDVPNTRHNISGMTTSPSWPSGWAPAPRSTIWRATPSP